MKTFRNCVLILLIILIGLPVFAQDQKKVAVTITANVRRARITLRGGSLGNFQGETPATFQLLPGRYSIRLQANGYETYSGALVVTTESKQTNEYTLQLARLAVLIKSNIDGASVIINGKDAGQTPATLNLPPGRYNLQLSADGYLDFETQLIVSRAPDQEHTFTLQPAEVAVLIKTNVAEASIYIDDEMLGATPLTALLLPGQHTIRLLKEDYQPLQATLLVSEDAEQEYTFHLIPAFATVNFIVAEKFLNKSVKNPTSLIMLFVDTEHVNPKGALEGIKIPVGRHEIELVSGGLSVHGVFNIEPGAVYDIELVMILQFLK